MHMGTWVPPLIPAAAVVLYEVQILDFLDSGQVDDFIAMSPEDRTHVPLSRSSKLSTHYAALQPLFQAEPL
ncbi:hypothetical protein FQN60_015735 [Etheostoma spectabile]|uniref:Uncharacterized protein n=1 Tax=Etheostoma spectabile TaxID=54343 RepID=A0A5J5CQP4_9PERO|nr:hypothetical protein FQN60_015735 [Etheostoma spectabile]